MKKIRVIWGYEVQSIEGTWVISDSPEYQINIDNTRGIGINNEAKKIAVLYEPQSILPGNYAEVLRNQNSYYKIFTHRKSLCDNDKVLHMPPFFPSWISESESIIYQKNKLVSMIASDKVMCDGHLYRQKIAGKFPYKNDLFGRGRNFIQNKIEGLRDYMFSVAMENEVSEIYYTEKILDCFLTGTIPIYWGSKEISSIFNPEGIIFLDDMDLADLKPELYYDRKNAIIDNFNRAKQIRSTSNHMIDYIIKKLS